MGRLFALLILCTVFWGPNLILADTIQLRSGVILNGKVIAQSRTWVRIRTDTGVRTISKQNIRRLSFGVTQDEMASRQRRRQEVERRNKELALARERQESARIAVEEKRLRELAEQERKAAEEQQKRAADLQADEEKRSAAEKEQQQRRAAELEEGDAPQNSQAGLSAWGALWRSALIPSWGQWSRGDSVKAGVIAGGMVIGGGALYETNRIYRNAARDLDAAGNPFAADTSLLILAGLYSEPTLTQLSDPVYAYFYTQPYQNQHANLDAKYHQTQVATLVIGLFYVYNLIDAWFFHPRNDTVSRSATIGSNESRWKMTFQVWSDVDDSIGPNSRASFLRKDGMTVRPEVRFTHGLHF
ncbi:MAG: hypothetical protein KDK39_10765 [Leptospiraceae bacterium]|nr:hypothetical protein [Leptospiraceae bacterium]